MSISRMALMAAAGLFAGGIAMPSAKAADLGGDCCADLEERVAELEATTARKGNRRVSLTVTGQVNRVILWFDDGGTNKTFYGLDNTNSSSRFSFLGSATVSPKVTMGFEIMTEVAVGATSARAEQLSEDGNGATNTVGNANHFNQPNGSSDALLGVRRAAAWVEHKDLGRVTLGRYESAGVVTTIDLGGVSAIASSSFALLNGNFKVRDKDTGQLTSMTWATLVDPAAAQGRTELLRYDSPTIAGFVGSASIGEAGDYWGAMLRWAGEYGGFRMAAGIGYEKSTDRAEILPIDPLGVASQLNTDNPSPKTVAWGGSLAALHVPSGLFVQGQYMHVSYQKDKNGDPTASPVLNSGYWGDGGAAAPFCAAATNGGFYDGTGCSDPGFKKDAHQWLIQAGWSKNAFGPGNTVIYGEYGKAIDWAGMEKGRDYPNFSVNSNPFDTQSTSQRNVYGIKDVTGSDIRVVGLGLVQNFDAAATEIFIGWRRFDADISTKAALGGFMVTSPGSPGLPTVVVQGQVTAANPTGLVAVATSGTPNASGTTGFVPNAAGVIPAGSLTQQNGGCPTTATVAACAGKAAKFDPDTLDVITAGVRIKF